MVQDLVNEKRHKISEIWYNNFLTDAQILKIALKRVLKHVLFANKMEEYVLKKFFGKYVCKTSLF